jgi:hypothetical protein
VLGMEEAEALKEVKKEESKVISVTGRGGL